MFIAHFTSERMSVGINICNPQVVRLVFSFCSHHDKFNRNDASFKIEKRNAAGKSKYIIDVKNPHPENEQGIIKLMVDTLHDAIVTANSEYADARANNIHPLPSRAKLTFKHFSDFYTNALKELQTA